MEQQNMEDLPKLLPLWHDVTLKDGHVRNIHLSHSTFPDHGGAGIDVAVSKTIIQCDELKAANNLADFRSPLYCLPFMEPNKVNSLYDPCLENLSIRRKKFKEFGGKLESGLLSMKCRSQFRKIITSAYNALSSDQDAENISVPLSIVEMVDLFPKDAFLPVVRWSYAGGCLDKIAISETSHLLLHPTGPKLNILAFTPIQESVGDIRYLNALENQEKRNISFEHGRIYQIIADSPMSSCCIRQEKAYYYINFDVSNADDISYSMEKFEFKERLSYLSMSKYVPYENLIVTENGNLLLQNADQKKIIWQLDEPLTHSSLINDLWWGCSFGSHPRSVLYNDALTFSSFDLRLKKSRTIDILARPNPFVLDSERITLVKRLGENDFQHLVATDVHLFIFDERYPQQPLMSWNHMLETFPMYCDIQPYQLATDSSNYAIALGTQESQDIAQFHLKTHCSKIQPVSLSVPLHLSKPSDCINSLKLHGQFIDPQLSKRLSMPLIGVSIIPHFKRQGYTVLQITSLGDVFYQDFKPKECDDDDDNDKTHRIGPGCVLKPSSEILPQVQEWLKVAIVKHKKHSEKLDDAVTIARVNKKRIIKAANKTPSSVCPLCTSSTLAPSDDENACPCCSLNYNSAKHLVQTFQKLGVLTKVHPRGMEKVNDSEQLLLDLPQFIDLTEVSDPLSKTLLEPWLENGNLPTLHSEKIHNMFVSLPDLSSQILEASTSQASTTQFEKSITLDESQGMEFEDIIPPSQDYAPGIYNLRKRKHSKKATQESVSGF